MYAVYRQLHPPSGIEHTLYCNFFSSTEKNLIIAGVNQLQVFRLNIDAETKLPEKNADGRVRKEKLECLAQFQLFGNIMSMESVRLASNSRDSLLLSFKDAKLSLVDYDPGTHDLKTSSLHYFEEEEMKDGCLQQSFNIPLVRVDPEGRCAAMLIYGTRLVILPFRRDTGPEDHETVVGAGKSPIMSSYIINLQAMDEKITNIIDFQFLHGYYEPTIFILFEPLPTWSGRVAVRKDSCTIVAISLNLQQKVHPVIWSLAGLPFDCFKVLAVQRPIGGVLVFGVNSLIYLNQSVPPYGVSLNSLTEFSTEFLLKPQEGVKIALDCCQACFIGEDRLVMSLKGGELYVVTLVVDGMRSVRNINFDKAAASVLTTCMCHCEEGYLFLGSRLGNSLLLKYTEKATEGGAPGDNAQVARKPDEPPLKKKKTDYMGDWMASDVSKLDDLDELEVYGSEAQTGTTITSYTFEVCDSILNIGPCAQTVMGEPAFLSEEFSNSVDPDIELVSTSGYGKNGALSVLQRSIRPQVVTTFELPGCQDMWTVVGPEKKNKEEKEEEEDAQGEGSGEGQKKDKENEDNEEVEGGHALLLLSRDDSSMVLETGQEINELDHSGFSTQGPTVYAGNLGNNKFILQVSPMGVRLLDGVNQIQHIPIDIGSPIVSCSVADPYVLIMSEEGVVMLLTLRDEINPRLAVIRPNLPQTSRILTLAAYCDVSGMFTTTSEVAEPETTLPTPEVKTSSINTLDPSKTTVDDEDELLYGSSESATLFESPEKEPAKEPSTPVKPKRTIEPTFWFICARENGVFEIYSLPEFKLVFRVKNFPVGHRVLVDSGQVNVTEPQSKKSSLPLGSEKPVSELLPVQELLIVGLGSKRSRPYLFSRVEEEVLLYEAFPYHAPAATDSHLKLRFRKVPHGLILREKRAKKTKEETIRHFQGQRWFRPFDNISGYSGVFLCGPYPHWLFMSQRGTLRLHPMGIDGTVTCFAPFHNVNCPRGFLYFNHQGELRISVLPTHLSYDAPWPIRKVPLRCTPHSVQYHMESKTYSVVTSIGELCNRMVRSQGEGEKEFDVLERDERFIYPMVEKFSVQLFSPLSWEAIPNTKFDLEDFEHVTCMKSVYLKSEGTVSGLKGYIALSTNYNYSEDVTSRGRILIYDVIEVVPEPGQPLTKNKIKIEYDKEQKGPVTALDHVQGFLITAIGQKIYIWQLKDGDLSGVAFIDTQVYIHSITTIKNLILIADILHSVSLLRYQVDMKVLSLVSRDVKPLEVYTAGFLVDNTTLNFLVSDRNKNLIVYTYQPEVRESQGGMRLLRQADINVGSHVNTFFRVRCKLSDPSTEKRAPAAIEKRHITYFTTLDGSLGYLMPITEKTYRRLSMLQTFLFTNIPHHAGLNPKAYRLMQSTQKLLNNQMKNIIDGELCWRYLHLSHNERSEIVHRIGTTDEQIQEDLMELDRYGAHF